MNRFWLFIVVSFYMFALAPLSFGADAPEWDFEFAKSEIVSIEGEKWHEKEYGWLLTARLSTRSRYTVRPVNHIRFEGLDAEGEVVWNGSKTIRRKDFSGSLGGQMEVFVRMLFKDLPAGVVTINARFDDGSNEEEE